MPHSKPTVLSLRTLPLCTAISLLSMPALAQDSLRSPALEEMIVTASRVEKPIAAIPNTVTVINEAELERQLSISHDLSTVLGNLVPGFSPSRQKLSNSGETLRGRNPLYLIDGVPQSNPLRDGSRDGITIDPAMIERIEIIHGANAVHGMGASGGIINLITRKPTDTLEQSIRVDITTPTDTDSDGLSGGLAYNFANRIGAWDLLFSVAHRETGVYLDADGRVIGVDGAQGDTMDSESQDIFFKGGYRGDGYSLHLMVNDFTLEGDGGWVAVPGNYEEGIPTTSEPGIVPGIAPTNDVRTISLDYRMDELLGHSLHAQLFSQDFEATYGGGNFATFQDPAYGDDVWDQSQNQSDKLGFKLTLARDAIAGLPVNIVWGMDVLRDETQQVLAQTNRAWVPPTEYENFAPFVQLEYTGIERLVVTGGLRHEESELNVDDYQTLYSYGSQQVTGGSPSFSETLYNIGATYEITDAVRIFGNVSEGSSMPDVGRVLRGVEEPNVEIESFLNLVPVITDNREMGIEYRTGQIQAEFSYYRSDSDYGSRLAMNDDGIFDVAREKTEISGFEVNLQWLFNGESSIGFAYARPEGEHDSNEDQRVDSDLDGSNITPPRLNVFWNQVWTQDFDTRLQVSRLMSRGYDGINDEGVRETYFEFDGYTLVDFAATWEIGRGVLQASLQNLTNEDYYTLFAQNRMSPDHNFKGRGRTLTLGYTYNF